MYPLHPLKVYAHESVRDDKYCMPRMERMLNAVGRSLDDLTWVDEDNMAEVVSEISTLWPPDEIPDGIPSTYTRPIVFTKIYTEPDFAELPEKLLQWTNTAEDATANAIRGLFAPVSSYHAYKSDHVRKMVCWPTMDFGLMMGCPHGCEYCGTGKHSNLLTIGLNVEEHMEKVVAPTIEQYPWQKCFRMIGWGAEMVAFEPEYGVFDLFTRKLAEYDRYGYFHAASSNVDWVKHLEHKDRLIAVFSVTCEAVTQQIEPGTGHAIDRIEAAAKLEHWGVPVRLKLKPTIPIRNWRQEYAQLIDDICRLTNPESIGFCVLIWNTIDSLLAKIDEDKLDPEFIQAARDAADEMAGTDHAPFPHEKRAEVYRFLIDEVRKHNTNTKLYISTETREMWDELAPALGQNPNSFFCGCSSVALPGGKISLSEGCPHSTYTTEDMLNRS